jgi:hypothetical protein
MVHEIYFIPNPMIGETSFPDFAFSANDAAEFVRISALD